MQKGWKLFEIYEIEHIIKDEERPVFLGENGQKM